MTDTAKTEAWTCRLCDAAFQCHPDQREQRMRHHMSNHAATSGAEEEADRG